MISSRNAFSASLSLGLGRGRGCSCLRWESMSRLASRKVLSAGFRRLGGDVDAASKATSLRQMQQLSGHEVLFLGGWKKGASSYVMKSALR